MRSINENGDKRWRSEREKKPLLHMIVAAHRCRRRRRCGRVDEHKHCGIKRRGGERDRGEEKSARSIGE